MLLQLSILVLIHLPSLISLDCHCDTCGETQFCTGDYCFVKKPKIDEDRTDSGCLTPRNDVWKDEVLPLCEKNQYNASLCVCNSGDFCNTAATFSKIVGDGLYLIPKLIECSDDIGALFDTPHCASSFCAFYDSRDYDEFFDLVEPPFTKKKRSCPTDEEISAHTFRIHLINDSPQMNSCFHIRYSPTSSQLTCFCNTPLCNSAIPMFNVTKRGKGKCYLKTPETETTTCWGDYCYWRNDVRGCIDASGDDNFKIRLGESSFGNDYFTICQGDYCNSDVLFPNGTIVGPSASIRKYGTNVANSLFIGPLLFLSFVYALV